MDSGCMAQSPRGFFCENPQDHEGLHSSPWCASWAGDHHPSTATSAWIVYTDCDGHGEAVHSIHLTEMGAYAAMKGWMQEGDLEMAEWDRVRGKTYQDKRMYQWESWGDESWMRRGADSVRIEKMELSQ